ACLADGAAPARHTHHEPTGAGARCVGCHMPRIVYGVLDIHRSHRIEVPDPARAAGLGRPDACTGCHADQSAECAAGAFRRLWPRRDPGVALPAPAAPAGAPYATTVLDGD